MAAKIHTNAVIKAASEVEKVSEYDVNKTADENQPRACFVQITPSKSFPLSTRAYHCSGYEPNDKNENDLCQSLTPL